MSIKSNRHRIKSSKSELANKKPLLTSLKPTQTFATATSTATPPFSFLQTHSLSLILGTSILFGLFAVFIFFSGIGLNFFIIFGLSVGFLLLLVNHLSKLPYTLTKLEFVDELQVDRPVGKTLVIIIIFTAIILFTNLSGQKVYYYYFGIAGLLGVGLFARLRNDISFNLLLCCALFASILIIIKIIELFQFSTTTTTNIQLNIYIEVLVWVLSIIGSLLGSFALFAAYSPFNSSLSFKYYPKHLPVINSFLFGVIISIPSASLSLLSQLSNLANKQTYSIFEIVILLNNTTIFFIATYFLLIPAGIVLLYRKLPTFDIFRIVALAVTILVVSLNVSLLNFLVNPFVFLTYVLLYIAPPITLFIYKNVEAAVGFHIGQLLFPLVVSFI